MTAVISYAVRACLPSRRWTGLVIVFGACLAFGLLAHVPDSGRRLPSPGWPRPDCSGWSCPSPPWSSATASSGPTSAGDVRVQLVVTRANAHPRPRPLAGGSATAVTVMAPAFALSAVVAGAPDAAAPAALAATTGAVAYVALFVAIGAVTRRSTLVSLLWVFLFERLLGTALTGIAQLSPTWESRAVFTGLAAVPADLVRRGIPSGWSAVGRLCVMTIVALAVATWRLGRLRLTGPAD